MDSKSIGSKNRKMKFFTQISSSPFLYWGCPDDVLSILEPFHLKWLLYSKPHNQLPKNDVLNISFSIEETIFEEDEKFVLSISAQAYLLTEDIQRAYEHGLYLQLPSRFEHSHYCKSELANLSYVAEHLLVEHDNDTSSPKQCELITYSHYGLSFDNQPYCKFIETKVAAMKLQGFNHSI